MEIRRKQFSDYSFNLKIGLIIPFVSLHGEQIAEAMLCLQGQQNSNLLVNGEPLLGSLSSRNAHETFVMRKNINKYLHTLTETVPSVSTVARRSLFETKIVKRK